MLSCTTTGSCWGHIQPQVSISTLCQPCANNKDTVQDEVGCCRCRLCRTGSHTVWNVHAADCIGPLHCRTILAKALALQDRQPGSAQASAHARASPPAGAGVPAPVVAVWQPAWSQGCAQLQLQPHSPACSSTVSHSKAPFQRSQKGDLIITMCCITSMRQGDSSDSDARCTQLSSTGKPAAACGPIGVANHVKQGGTAYPCCQLARLQPPHHSLGHLHRQPAQRMMRLPSRRYM